MNWTFYINDTEVDEPQGLSELILNIKRNEVWHGVFFEASETELTFYGTGAAILKAEKQANGLSSAATYRMEADCDTSTEVLEGSFDFGTYLEKCGNDCAVQISVEKSGCVMTMNNRYEQDVDLSKTTAFDNETLLEDYNGLNFEIELLPQQISIGDEAEMSESSISEVISDSPNWTDSTGFNDYIGYTAPAFPVITNESLGSFNSSPIIQICGPLEGVANRPPYPDFPTAIGTSTLVGDIECGLESSEVTYRLKGSYDTVISGASQLGMRIKLFKLPNGLDGTVAANWTEEYAQIIFSVTATASDTFDISGTIPVTIEQGDFFYFGILTTGTNLAGIDYFTFSQDPECFFKILTSATCDSTDAEVSLINETGSRIVEAITDGCLTLKSDYYGRTDSKPYASESDGCGSLRVLSNGLRLRNAETSNHFISLRDFFNGLRGIDNIGMGIEENTVLTGNEWLRIEPVEYFYQNIKILEIDLIPEAQSALEPTSGYSTVKIGYDKWEVDTVNGLNEFNSNKIFRTSLKTINNELNAQSNFVAGGIPIEITRQQSFAVTGSADTKYDNDTFIICVTRDGTYSVTFDAAGNKMTFYTSGTGDEFLIGSITIAGTVSNNGARTILSTSLLSVPGQRVQVEITFVGGATTDEVSDTVTFTGITSTGMFVEKGNIDNAANIFSPSTAYNWRIRPFYNLMRWFKSIAQSYINLSNTASKLFFASGTGNYIAEGELTSPDICKLENAVVAENDSLSKNEFNDTDWTPIFKAESISFNYPLSISDYLAIKANPYGYINLQCGTGVYEKAFIKSIAYKPAQGEAQFTLIKKWQ